MSFDAAESLKNKNFYSTRLQEKGVFFSLIAFAKLSLKFLQVIAVGFNSQTKKAKAIKVIYLITKASEALGAKEPHHPIDHTKYLENQVDDMPHRMFLRSNLLGFPGLIGFLYSN